MILYDTHGRRSAPSLPLAYDGIKSDIATKCTDATFSHATSYTLGRENFFEAFPGLFVDCDLDDTGEVG